jgi:hypothetical protein
VDKPTTTPQQENELPRLTHRRGQHHACGGNRKRQRDGPARSKAIHRRGRKGSNSAEQQEIDPEREGDRRA